MNRSILHGSMRAYLAALLCILLAALLVPATPAEASTDRTTTIVLVGDAPNEFLADEVGDVILDLEADAESSFAREAIRDSREFAQDDGWAPAPMSTTKNYEILASWRDKWARSIILRRGSGSWGWNHINNKHGLRQSTLKGATKHYFERKADGGQAYRYRTYAREYTCSGGTCRVTKQVVIRLIHDRTKQSDGKFKGIITAYCEGYSGICPTWVNNALNA